MKAFDLNAIIFDSQGQPIKVAQDAVARYKDFAIKALLTSYQDETLSYETKFFRVILAEKIKTDSTVVLTFAEAMLMTELVSRLVQDPVITTRFLDLFDFTPDPVPQAELPEASLLGEQKALDEDTVISTKKAKIH